MLTLLIMGLGTFLIGLLTPERRRAVTAAIPSGLLALPGHRAYGHDPRVGRVGVRHWRDDRRRRRLPDEVAGPPLARQLPCSACTSGKNMSFHDSGFTLIEPIRYMKSA